MKKRISVFLISILLCLACAFPVWAGTVSRLDDQAGLLDAEQQESLSSTLDEISERDQVDVVVVTVNSLEGKTAQAYAEDYFIDHEVEGSHIQIGVDLCKKYKESAVVINTVASHHGDVEPESLVACIVQAADAISAARPGARRETLETYTNRLKQLEDITNEFKGVDKSFAIQAGREIRVMVIPEQVNDADMVLLARDISKQIEAELEYPGQIKVNVIRESRAVDYAK